MFLRRVFLGFCFLQVSPSLVRLLERPLSASVSVECSRGGVALRRAIKSFVRMKCHAIVLDCSLNGYPTVVRAVYNMFLVAAMRTHCYVQRMAGQGGGGHAAGRNAAHLAACVCEAVEFGARLIHTRTRNKRPHQPPTGTPPPSAAGCGLFTRCVSLAFADGPYGPLPSPSQLLLPLPSPAPCAEAPGHAGQFGHCAVSPLKAVWLGLKGFHAALSRRAGMYGPVLAVLRARIRATEERMERREGQRRRRHAAGNARPGEEGGGAAERPVHEEPPSSRRATPCWTRPHGYDTLTV